MGSLLDQMKVERLGVPKHSPQEVYHKVLKMSWVRFVSMAATIYLLLNALFALLYWLGDHTLAHSEGNSYFDAFVFSVQTFATIGYGYLLPQTVWAHFLVFAESIFAIIYIALFTGLTFAKFSRPTVNVIFSRKAVVMNYDGVPHLMLRLGNGRDTNIVDAQIKIVTLVAHTSKEGYKMQRFVDLDLVRSHSPFFVLTWTVMHRIDENSPFFGLSQEEFRSKAFNLFVSLSGYDETYSQSVHTAWRYLAEDIHFAKKFVDVVDVRADGTRVLNFSQFHEVV